MDHAASNAAAYCITPLSSLTWSPVPIALNVRCPGYSFTYAHCWHTQFAERHGWQSGRQAAHSRQPLSCRLLQHPCALSVAGKGAAVHHGRCGSTCRSSSRHLLSSLVVSRITLLLLLVRPMLLLAAARHRGTQGTNQSEQARARAPRKSTSAGQRRRRRLAQCPQRPAAHLPRCSAARLLPWVAAAAAQSP